MCLNTLSKKYLTLIKKILLLQCSNSSSRIKTQSILFQMEEVFKDVPGENAIWTRKADFKRACVDMDIRVAWQNKTGEKRLEVL